MIGFRHITNELNNLVSSISITYIILHRGSPLLPILGALSVCHPRQPSHYPSNLTSVCSSLEPNLLIYFLYLLSDPLYSPTLFNYILVLLRTSSFVTLHPFMSLLPYCSTTSSRERSLFFSLHFSYPMSLHHAMPLHRIQ